MRACRDKGGYTGGDNSVNTTPFTWVSLLVAPWATAVFTKAMKHSIEESGGVNDKRRFLMPRILVPRRTNARGNVMAG